MVLLIVQAFLLVSSVVIGLLISIPVGISTSNFHDSCLLYSNVNENGNNIEYDNNDDKLTLNPGPTLTCNFCIFTGSISLLLAIVLLLGTSFLLCKNHDIRVRMKIITTSNEWGTQLTTSKRKTRNPIIGAWVHFGAASGMSLLLFITACLISSGFHSFCEQGLKTIGVPLERCDYLEDYVGSFYTHLSISQVSSWVGTLIWIILAIIGKLRLRKLNPNKSEYNKACTTSDGHFEEIDLVSEL